MLDRVRETREVLATMRRARVLAPLRPDKYLRIAAAARREGATETLGFAIAARRCPQLPGLIDELGTLTWRELDERSDALAAALQTLPAGTPETIGIMCRNHRGFVEALVAVHRIGADVVLLNTSFAGPACAVISFSTVTPWVDGSSVHATTLLTSGLSARARSTAGSNSSS